MTFTTDAGEGLETGAGLDFAATGFFADTTVGLAGTVFKGADLTAGAALTTFFAGALATLFLADEGLLAGTTFFEGAAFFTAFFNSFFTTFFAAGFLAAAFGFAAFLAAGFLAIAFLTGFLAGAFLAVVFFGADFFTAAFFTDAFLALEADFLVAIGIFIY